MDTSNDFGSRGKKKPNPKRFLLLSGSSVRHSKPGCNILSFTTATNCIFTNPSMKENELLPPFSSYSWFTLGSASRARMGTWSWKRRKISSIPFPKKELSQEPAWRLPGCEGIVLFSAGARGCMMCGTKRLSNSGIASNANHSIKQHVRR